MSDDMGRAFDELIEGLASPDAPHRVEVVEIAERASMVEFLVPIANYPDPEVVLFRTIAGYLESTPRRPVVAISVGYEVRSHNQPFLIAAVMLGEPI